MERIAFIYSLKLEHIEWGERSNGKAIMISRVGWQLVSALKFGKVLKKDALNQIQLDELHGQGFAHCDISVDNIFYMMTQKRF